MSRYRPGQRDVLEQVMLAMVRGRSLAQKEFEAEVAELQRRLDRVETPRLRSARDAAGDECDPMERLERLPDERSDAREDETRGVGEFAEVRDAEYWRRATLRMTAFALSALRRVCDERERPKLEACVARLVIGDSCLTMREVAGAYGLSVERISQRVEAVRVRANFPKNQHNKSSAAVESYRNAAKNRKGMAA